MAVAERLNNIQNLISSEIRNIGSERKNLNLK